MDEFINLKNKAMTITLQKQIEETVEVQIPSFYRSKDEKDYLAILDENTVVSIYDSGSYRSITNSELWVKGSAIHNAVANYHSCTESEFLDKYAEVERAMSLHPILVP